MKMEALIKANSILEQMQILENNILKCQEIGIKKLKKDNPILFYVDKKTVAKIKELIIVDAKKQLEQLSKELDAL